MSYFVSFQFNSNKNLQWCAAISLIMYWAYSMLDQILPMVDIYYTIGCGSLAEWAGDSWLTAILNLQMVKSSLKHIETHHHLKDILSFSSESFSIAKPNVSLLAIFFITDQSTSSTCLGFQDFGSLDSSHNSHAKQLLYFFRLCFLQF